MKSMLGKSLAAWWIDSSASCYNLCDSALIQPRGSSKQWPGTKWEWKFPKTCCKQRNKWKLINHFAINWRFRSLAHVRFVMVMITGEWGLELEDLKAFVAICVRVTAELRDAIGWKGIWYHILYDESLNWRSKSYKLFANRPLHHIHNLWGLI